MTLSILIIAAVMAPAPGGSDQPHRDWGQIATLDMSVTDATACIMRATSRGGASAQIIPADGGNDIDYRAAAGLFGGSVGKPWITYQVRQAGSGSLLTILYRHPYRQSMAAKQFRDLRKRCRKVASVNPR